jgi:hypothetical protein
MQHFVFPNFWQSCRANNFGGKFKSEAISYETLPLNFKNQSQMLLIALLLKTDCTVFCALSKLTSVDPTKIGHIKRKTFLQFFGLLFRYHQTVEMPASTNHFDKIFHTLFYSYFFCFGANSQFHCFFIVFEIF